MKHLHSFDELNEVKLSDITRGIGKVVDYFFKTKYRVSFTAELESKKNEEPFSWRSYVTIKAKDEDDAEDKFLEMWNHEIKKLKKEPKMIIGTIRKATHHEDKKMEFPRTMKDVEPKKEAPKKSYTNSSPTPSHKKDKK